MGKYKALFLFLLSVILVGSEDEKTAASKYTSQGMTAFTAGDYPLAIESFKKAFALRPDYSALAYNISCCHTLLGETDSAIVWLETTFELGSYLFLEDEDLVSLHKDPRYQNLVLRAEHKIKELQDRDWEPVVELPESYSGDEMHPAVIGLHGFGTSPVDFAKSLGTAVIEAGYVFCCPYGPFIRGTTSFGWGDCRGAEERILESVQYLKGGYMIDDERIVLFGYSQGGSIAFYTGFKNPEIFAGVISVAGYYDEELNQYLQDENTTPAPTYIMIGENDFGLESNMKAEQLIKDRGVGVQLVVYEGLGHAFPPNGGDEVKKALKWIELAE